MISQNYANIGQTLQDVNIKNIIEYTKDYTHSKLVAFLKMEYGPVFTLVMEQITLYAKAQKKLPHWVSRNCFFTQKSLEQCSSWPLAVHKLELISGKRLIDLSAGLGVDDVAFSQSFEEVVGIDNDSMLNEIARHNFKCLGVNNINRQDGKAEEWLKKGEHKDGDVYYIDADRRPDGNQRIYTLDGASPDVLSLIPHIHQLGSPVLLKVSPMIDITYLIRACPTAVLVSVVGIKNEVKEVLVLLRPDKKQDALPIIEAVEVNESGACTMVFPFRNTESPEQVMENGTFFYEPSNMLIKAGLSQQYAAKSGLTLISRKGHYMTSSGLVNNYFGRTFRVINHGGFSKSQLKEYLKQNNIRKANVSARNFVTGVDELRSTFSLEDGGEDYLFFTLSNSGDKLYWHCKKLV